MVLLIIILILILFILSNNFFRKIEYYSEKNIIFYRKNNLYKILKKDDDKYFESFFENDYKVRNIRNINEYYEILENSLCDPDEEIINKIKNYIIIIKNKLKNINRKKYGLIDLDKFKNIKWKIGLVCDNKYENGLPHTRNDIIILNKNKINFNSDKKNIKTLIHEQIHVYQKLFPENIKKYLDYHKFKKIKKITKFDNIRANPDLDNYIYQDKNNNTYKATYNKNPTSIEDITYFPYNSQFYEHPNERMAIEFESIIDN